MRDDMYKVIVERPRRKAWETSSSGRAYRNSEELGGNKMPVSGCT